MPPSAPRNSTSLRLGPHAGAVEDLDQRHAGPLRGADGAQAPLLAFGGPIEQRAAVAGALERDDQRLRSHVLEIADREAQRPLDEAADRQPEGRRRRDWACWKLLRM